MTEASRNRLAQILFTTELLLWSRDVLLCTNGAPECGREILEPMHRNIHLRTYDRRGFRCFANNPLLKERGIRFYARVPLRVSDQPVGSICLLDIRARRFSQEDRRVLQLMADGVVEEVDQRVDSTVS